MRTRAPLLLRHAVALTCAACIRVSTWFFVCFVWVQTTCRPSQQRAARALLTRTLASVAHPQMAGVSLAAAPVPLARRCRAPRSARASPCVAAKQPPASSSPGGAPKKPAPTSRGPGQAPLRMQTDDQRKFGYSGDGGSGGRDDDGGWQPGGSDDGANPIGLAILVACGLWAYFEYKRPGGKLNPRAAEYPQQRSSGSSSLSTQRRRTQA